MENAQDSFVTQFNRIARCAHTNATAKGFHDNKRPFSTDCMLIVTEIAEAVEADRKDLSDDKIPSFHGKEAELADAIIRIMDTAVEHNLRVAEAVLVKMAFNAQRDRLHGGKAY